jgi:DNA-binding transcriptional regulator GbsR (MarR family)
MTLKRTIKYHPEISSKTKSLIEEQTFIDELRKLKAAQESHLAANTKAIEKLREATQPKTEITKYLEQLRKATQPSSDYTKAIEKLREATQPKTEITKYLEQLRKATQPSSDYTKAIEKLREATQPKTEITKYLEQLRKATNQEDYQKTLKDALQIRDLF